ncbi:MAG: coiled coil domain-containing protein [Calditrichae bacterium]|nr:coiled coil domain-containing protein [Calditrichia bacterium]
METKKEIYQQKMEAKLDQLNAQIDTYIAKFDENKADAKMEIQETIDELTNQQKSVERKLNQMKSSGKDAWMEMRSGLDDAVDQLENSYNQAVEKMSQVAQ